MSMSHPRGVVDAAVSARVRAMLARTTLAEVSRAIGVDPRTVRRIADGERVQRAVMTAVRVQLPDLERQVLPTSDGAQAAA